MGLKRQQTYCLAATAQGQDEQTGASILSRPRIADHGTFVSVIDLCFFTRRRADHGAGLGCLVSTQPTNKALHRQIARSKAMLGHQILPDGHGIAARTQAELDGFPEWFAGRWRWSGFFRGGTAQPYAKPGDHLVGRFCRRSPSPGSWRSHPNARGLQVGTGRFPAHAGLLLDAS